MAGSKQTKHAQVFVHIGVFPSLQGLDLTAQCVQHFLAKKGLQREELQVSIVRIIMRPVFI